MSRSRIALVAALAAMIVGCVEQEPYRPTEDDKKKIRENLLSKAPEMKFKVNAILEDKVVYLGLDLDKDVIIPGEQFKLTHYWQVKKAVPGWKVFVHLNGPKKSGFLNADHIPMAGRYPATQWKAGEIIRDEHKVTLPGGYKESKVMVYTGLWKGKLRLKIKKGPQDEESRILAATLPVGVKGVKVATPKRLIALKVPKAAVTVDGKLDEAAWSKAPSTGAFVETMNGGKASVKTEAKVAWDESNIYLAFAMEDSDVWSSLKGRDDKLWTQEAVEIFIDANGDKKDYVELQVNPNGAIFDSYLAGYRKNDNTWNSTMKVAVNVDGTVNKRGDTDKGWTVEMAIPWEDTKGRSKAEMTFPPKVGDVWRVNLFRMDMPSKKPQQASAWSPPLVGDFHKLDRFGDLVFGDEEGKAPEAKAAAAPAEPPKEPKLAPNLVRMKQVDPRSLRAKIPLRRAPPRLPSPPKK